MKGKKKPQKEIKLKTNKANRMEGKTYYMRNIENSSFLDCNNLGDLYFSLEEPCKWEFIKTDINGTYYIKHVNTGLYLTSDEAGDLFATVELKSSFQKWNVFQAEEQGNADIYGYQNLSNELYLHVNLKDDIYLDTKKEDPNLDKIRTGFFRTFAKFPKK